MADRSLLFVHSPLVGPSSLRRIAQSASELGFEVALPDLTAVASASRPHEDYVRRTLDAARSMSSPVTIVGHSGAGVYLPTIGRRAGRGSSLVFVDAVLPPPTGVHATSDGMKALLDANTHDGVLRPWLTWWPPEVVSTLLPDRRDRVELLADMPRLPRSFYDIDVAVPTGWSTGACAYLRLGTAYDAEFDEAVRRRWPTAELDSTHLGVHTDADRVLAEVVQLVDGLK